MLFDTATSHKVKDFTVHVSRYPVPHLSFKKARKDIGHVEFKIRGRTVQISKFEIHDRYRKYAHTLIKEGVNRLKGYGLLIVVSISALTPKGLTEKEKREVYEDLGQLFLDAGFYYDSLNTLVFGRSSVDYSALSKPLNKVVYEDINKPKHYWQSMDDDQYNRFREMCFSYFRRTGFPHVPSDRPTRINWLQTLMATDINLVEGDDVGQNLTGLPLAWSFHPHAWSVPCNKNMMTVMDAFNDDKKLYLLIDRLLDFYPAMSRSNLFGRIKMLSGVQAVSNFRPTAAAALYEHFGGGDIQDMSGGWGGRMLGAFRAPNVRSYVATEPSSLTHKGLCEQAEFLNGSGLFVQKPMKVHKLGSEVFRPDRHSIDFAFTSPPYFNCEQYASEKTQSFVKFPGYDLWLEGFLLKTFQNVYHGLRPGKYMAINIANIKGAGDIETDTVRMGKEAGFKYVKTMYLLLSRAGSGHKREPIFIFRKKNK